MRLHSPILAATLLAGTSSAGDATRAHGQRRGRHRWFSPRDARRGLQLALLAALFLLAWCAGYSEGRSSGLREPAASDFRFRWATPEPATQDPWAPRILSNSIFRSKTHERWISDLRFEHAGETVPLTEYLLAVRRPTNVSSD